MRDTNCLYYKLSYDINSAWVSGVTSDYAGGCSSAGIGNASSGGGSCLAPRSDRSMYTHWCGAGPGGGKFG